MKDIHPNKIGIYEVLVVLALIYFLLTGCCRPATEFQVQKWEHKYKFESPRGFWGLHIRIGKKDVYKYK